METPTRKIYIAAVYGAMVKAEELATILSRHGFEVTSEWHHRDESDLPKAICAERDLNDLTRANTLILLAEEPSSTGGKHFETGFAYAEGLEIIVIGREENIFHHMDDITVVPDVIRLKEALEREVQHTER